MHMYKRVHTQIIYNIAINLPGQHLSLHIFWVVLKPMQSFPPQSGIGLLHLLVSVCVPLPHVLLHDP